MFSEKIKFDLSDFECYAQNQSNSCTIPVDTDVNWTYIRHSEDVLDVFWTSYVRSIYVLTSCVCRDKFFLWKERGFV